MRRCAAGAMAYGLQSAALDLAAVGLAGAGSGS